MRKLLATLALLVFAATIQPASALTDQEELVQKATTSFEGMQSSGDFTEMHRLLGRAKAVLIVPELLKAGFFLGVEGGNGVLYARTHDGGWSGPAFYTIGGASLGLQAVAQSSEVVFLIMTDKGLHAVLDSKVKIGADASIALGTIGKGVGAGTGMAANADIYALASTEGLFGGAAFDGSVISARDEWNAAVYGQGVTPRAILFGSTKPVMVGGKLRSYLAKS